MKFFRDYPTPTQANLARQLQAQAGGHNLFEYWTAALEKINPQLSSHPAFPDAIVGEVAQLVQRLKPYNIVFGKPNDSGLYGREVKNVSQAQAKRDFLEEFPTYKVHKVEDWYQ